MKLVKDNENESNSQPSWFVPPTGASCVKLVKDNESESNSQQAMHTGRLHHRCVKLVKDNENESNSQHCLSRSSIRTSMRLFNVILCHYVHFSTKIMTV